MPARHRSRQSALQLLFLWDLRRQPVDEAIDSFYRTLSSEEDDAQPAAPDDFMETLVRGTVEQAAAIDREITAHSEHWRLDRMPAVDRNILRVAVYEMRNVGTPPAVVIDEALELAKQFSGEESARFVNGVLDGVRRHLERPAAGEESSSEARSGISGKQV